MTFFFNLINLETICKDDPKKFMEILESFYYKKLPGKSRTNYDRTKLVGSSFLLNPEPLFKINKQVDILYVLQYIKLAAKRDYFLYIQYDIKSLQLSYYPDLNIETVKTNPLLKITEKEIFFKYEELTRKNNGKINY